MKIYLICIIISMLFGFLSTKVNKKFFKILYMILSFLPLFLIAGARFDIGTDYSYRYIPIFNIISKGSKVPGLELAFDLLIRICLIFSKNYYLLFWVTSFIILSLMYFTIFKQSKICTLSIFMLLFEGFYFQSLNIVRQYIGVAIMFFAAFFVINKKEYVKFYIALIISVFFHSASIITVMFPFLKKKNIFNIFVLFSIVLLIFVLGPSIGNIISQAVSSTKYNYYITSGYNRSEIRLAPLIINSLIYIFIYILYCIKYKSDKEKIKNKDFDNFFINVQGIAILLFCLGSVHYLFFRLGYYFSIFNIISVPYFIHNKLHIKKNKIVAIASIVILLCANIFYTNILHNEEEIKPYKTYIHISDYFWR